MPNPAQYKDKLEAYTEGKDPRAMQADASGVQLALSGVSDNVGGVKQFLSTLPHALGEERHFALVEGFAFSNPGSLVIQLCQELDPTHASLRSATAIMITRGTVALPGGGGSIGLDGNQIAPSQSAFANPRGLVSSKRV